MMLTENELRMILRGELLPMFLGMLLILLWLTSWTVAAVSKRMRNAAVVSLGAFAGLYGFRLLFALESIEFAFPGLGHAFRFGSSFITYIILPISGFFWREVLSARWRKVIHCIIALQAALALCGIASDIYFHQPFVLGVVNNVVVIVSLCLASALLLIDLRSRKTDTGLRVLLAGFACLLCAVVWDNLSGFRGAGAQGRVEALGLTLFLISAAFYFVRRTLVRERRLIVLDTEMEQARRIQHELLPQRPPVCCGLEIAACYLPMRSVAGDFYDFLELSGDRLGVIVADVSGHGVAAALVASMVKTAVSLNREYANSPAQMLVRLNAAFCGQLQGRFVTAIYAVFDPAAKRMTYAGAAHPALVLRRADDGAAETLECNGLPLGLFDFATYSEQETEFCPGDRVLLYTDGLLEATNEDGVEFGHPRVLEFLNGRPASARAVVDSVVDAVQAWQAHAEEPSDDLTMVLVSCHSDV